MRAWIARYSRLLTWLLVGTVVVLLVPVSLQIFSRLPGEIVPRYIWTEEMARLIFIWMIMIGAMLGVRDRAHFDVDVWPDLPPRRDALLRLVSSFFMLLFALAFVWYGTQFTVFGWEQTSEIADLPMWMIFIAWPITGVTWLAFLGQSAVTDLRIVAGRTPG